MQETITWSIFTVLTTAHYDSKEYAENTAFIEAFQRLFAVTVSYPVWMEQCHDSVGIGALVEAILYR